MYFYFVYLSPLPARKALLNKQRPTLYNPHLEAVYLTKLQRIGIDHHVQAMNGTIAV
jgi:hypothetical protein